MRSASLRPACCSAAARTSGSFTRRNGFVARSSAIVDGAGLAPTALRLRAGLALLQQDIGRFDRLREAQVRKRVLATAKHAGIPGQRGELGQRIDHLYGRTLEQPSTAAREQRVAAEDERPFDSPSDTSDMASRMTGHVEHRELESDARNRDRVAFREDARNARDRLARRSEYGGRPAREERAIAADMIAMVMRVHDRGELELLAIEVREHRGRVAGIDDAAIPPSRSNQM